MINFYRPEVSNGYPPEFNEVFKRYIRRREGYKCAICQHKRRLDIHHIDYIKAHTTRNNCVAICRICHNKIHIASYNIRSIWRSKLMAFVRKQEANYESKRQRRTGKNRTSYRKGKLKTAKIQTESV